MQLTSVMYHYVRPIRGSKFPNIKGLELSGFLSQLDYLQSEYNIVSPEHFLSHLTDGTPLPPRPCLLTFDDGYRDHFDFVLPELLKRGLTAFFFPPACAIRDNQLLDVNAIHFILAAKDDPKALLQDLKQQWAQEGMTEARWEALWSSMDLTDRFDVAEVIFFKRVLQRELSQPVRSRITQRLFEKYVKTSQQEFCKELYMTQADLRELMAHGMYVGNHTYNHIWLNSLSKTDQMQELVSSQKFLATLGAPQENWIMCYPYGGYNAETLEILRSLGCIAGFTVKVGTTNLASDDPLQINRFDTNDFPK